jgi:hypothetical protein
MRPSMNASSHTVWRGQVLRHVSIACAYVRGRLDIHSSNSTIAGFTPSRIATPASAEAALDVNPHCHYLASISFSLVVDLIDSLCVLLPENTFSTSPQAWSGSSSDSARRALMESGEVGLRFRSRDSGAFWRIRWRTAVQRCLRYPGNKRLLLH